MRWIFFCAVIVNAAILLVYPGNASVLGGELLFWASFMLTLILRHEPAEEKASASSGSQELSATLAGKLLSDTRLAYRQKEHLRQVRFYKGELAPLGFAVAVHFLFFGLYGFYRFGEVDPLSAQISDFMAQAHVSFSWFLFSLLDALEHAAGIFMLVIIFWIGYEVEPRSHSGEMHNGISEHMRSFILLLLAASLPVYWYFYSPNNYGAGLYLSRASWLEERIIHDGYAATWALSLPFAIMMFYMLKTALRARSHAFYAQAGVAMIVSLFLIDRLPLGFPYDQSLPFWMLSIASLSYCYKKMQRSARRVFLLRTV